MQAQQILMFDGRKDFYEWITKSDLAMEVEEVENTENKKSVVISPLQTIKTYEDYVNYFNCDSIQTMAWSTKIDGEEKPRISLIAIHIASQHYVPESTETTTEE